MSYDERLLREYVRGVLLREKLTAGAVIGGGGERVHRATGGYSYKDIKKAERADCDSPLGCFAALIGQPQSFVDAINAIFGEEGLFNISALWKTDVNFLGEKTLKPAWDFLMDTLSMESTPRPKVGEDFWANMFGRTSSAVSTSVSAPASSSAAAPSVTPPLPAGTSLADRIAATATTTESVMLIFEGDDSSGDAILSAFQADIVDINSSINAIKSAQTLTNAMSMLGDLIGSDVNLENIMNAMDKAEGSFDSEEILTVFKNSILPEVLNKILDFVESSISNSSDDSLLSSLSPGVKSSMISSLSDLASSL